MRKSEIQILEIGIKLQVHLGLTGFTFKHHDDQSKVEIKTYGSVKPHEITSIIGNYDTTILTEDDAIIIRIYEPLI